MIAKFVSPCWYLIVFGETRWLLGQSRNDYKIRFKWLSLTQDVYITRTRYQGNSYILRIDNASLKTPGFPN